MKTKSIDFSELEAYLNGYWLSDLANFSSYLFHHLPDLNWVGCYLNDGEKLRLGPFCGRPACFEIPYGKGVCGTAYSTQKTIVVADVDQFDGHIVCDTNSKSEIVIPLFIDAKLVGVIDIDSPILNRFQGKDQHELEKAVNLLSQKLTNDTQFQFGIILKS